MRVFLAGATGVIGTPLVPQLLEAGHEVTAMTRSVLRAAQLEAAGAAAVACDVYDADGVRAAMADCSPDAVIHQLTSLPPRIDFADPVHSTRTTACGPRGPGSSSTRRWRPAHAA
jgi:nucleoside-diphosphate-sugar epimerase